jgi:RNA polymerase sigma-70 factor, ECF subfamily
MQAAFWLEGVYPNLSIFLRTNKNCAPHITGNEISCLMRCMEESDDSIRRAVLSGDKDAYRVLVARYSQIVFRVAYRITGDESDAEEAVQEAFMRGYQKLKNFEGRSSMATWIYRIGVNCSLDIVARRKPETRIGEENDPERREVQLPDATAGPDRLLLSREIEAAQQAAMNDLTPTEQTAFALRHMEDRSTEEIAAALNIAPNAAKQAVFRAVRKLRRHLAPLWVNP